MLYVNLHSLVKDVILIQGYQHICSFPEGVDNYEFLMGCDMLITDYSSVLFDFALTKDLSYYLFMMLKNMPEIVVCIFPFKIFHL